MALDDIGNTAVRSASGQTLPVINPDTDTTFDALERDNAADLDAAVSAAHHCLDTRWSRLTAAEGGDSMDALLARADKALHAGKQAGRNRVVWAPAPG